MVFDLKVHLASKGVFVFLHYKDSPFSMAYIRHNKSLLIWSGREGTLATAVNDRKSSHFHPLCRRVHACVDI